MKRQLITSAERVLLFAILLSASTGRTRASGQTAPQSTPYGRTPQSNSAPAAPKATDYYAADPADPTRFLADFKELIAIAGRGNSQRVAPEFSARLRQDFSSCANYVDSGVLSQSCCTNLVQAANFNMEATEPAQRQSQMYQRNLAATCTFQAPDHGSPVDTLQGPSDPPVAPVQSGRLQTGTSQTCAPAEQEPELNVEWQQWCGEWKNAFDSVVLSPLEGRWGQTGYTLCYEVTSTIYSNGQFSGSSHQLLGAISTESRPMYPSATLGIQFVNEVTIYLNSLQGHAPPFPKGSQLQQVNHTDDILFKCQQRRPVS